MPVLWKVARRLATCTGWPTERLNGCAGIFQSSGGALEEIGEVERIPEDVHIAQISVGRQQGGEARYRVAHFRAVSLGAGESQVHAPLNEDIDSHLVAVHEACYQRIVQDAVYQDSVQAPGAQTERQAKHAEHFAF